MFKKLSFHGKRITLKTITLCSLLIAIQVILNKFSIGDPSIVEIGLGFIGTAIIGYMLGPWIGGIALALTDIISNTILNLGTSFFPGFTLSAYISGVISGLFLYKQKIKWQRIFIYELFQIIVSNIFFNTLWIYIISKASPHHITLLSLITLRLPKEFISWPIESFIILIILKSLNKINIDF